LIRPPNRRSKSFMPSLLEPKLGASGEKW